jgi:hypothetical protein
VTAVLVLSWAQREGLDKWQVDRIVEIPRVGALLKKKKGLRISVADIPASMAKVPSLRWEISKSALYRDLGAYAGDLGEGIGLVDQMNQRGDS